MSFLYPMLAVGVIVSGLLMMGLTIIYRSPSSDDNKQRKPRKRPSGASNFVQNFLLNSTLSLALVCGLTYLLFPYLYDEAAASVLRIVLEGAAILMLYDFFYYLVHRYAFHEWKVLRRVHAVHHIVRTPSAVDSLFLHPVESFLGVALFWTCTGLVVLVAGPVSIYAFAWAFFMYSILNVVIHSGLNLPAFPFAPINYLAERHQKHHHSMNAGNFASVTPVFDLLFGTEVR